MIECHNLLQQEKPSSASVVQSEVCMSENSTGTTGHHLLAQQQNQQPATATGYGPVSVSTTSASDDSEKHSLFNKNGSFIMVSAVIQDDRMS